jgi:cell wall-associated NlpC family hydrolase
LSKPSLDPRRHPYRQDLAGEELRGRVSAPRFVTGQVRQVVHSATPLRGAPEPRASWTSEVLFGEHVTVYDEKDGWAWVQLARDGYVGYLRAGALSPQVKPATHRVRALSTFLYPLAEVKAPPWLPLAMGSTVNVAEAGPVFAKLADGSFVPMRHIAELTWRAPDFVAIAERFMGTPYLWGGKTRQGLDCSGLVQVAMQMAGLGCPRDSDMQLAELGREIPLSTQADGLERGDLVFWPGHVGIMTDAFFLLHANAHHMAVAVEPLRAAADRSARGGVPITAIKRLDLKAARSS